MARRLTDDGKWRDKWFRKLTDDAKLVFLWLCDNTDQAGFIELDEEVMEFEIGKDVERLNEALRSLGKPFKGYERVLVREGICWLRNRAKIQCGSTDLSSKGPFQRGCLNRLLEHETLFPEVRKAYKGFESLGKAHNNNNKSKSKSNRGSGGEPARAGGLPYPPEDASEIERWRGKNEHYDAMTDGGVRMRYDEFKATARLAGAGDDLNWAKVVEKMIWKQGTGELTKASGYMASLIKSPDFKLGVEEGGLDENGRSAAWHEQASQINKLYSHHKISADGVREMHEQHRGGVDHDMAAYDRGEGPLQAEFPMDKPEEDSE